MVVTYLSHDLALGSPESAALHVAVLGLMLTLSGFSTFAYTLILHASAVATTRQRGF